MANRYWCTFVETFSNDAYFFVSRHKIDAHYDLYSLSVGVVVLPADHYKWALAVHNEDHSKIASFSFHPLLYAHYYLCAKYLVHHDASVCHIFENHPCAYYCVCDHYCLYGDLCASSLYPCPLDMVPAS